MRAMKQIWSYAGLGTSIRFCVSQRDGEGTRIDIDLATSFFSQFPQFSASPVPAQLNRCNSGSGPMERVTISMSDEFAAELAAFMDGYHYENRSEAVRDLARLGLKRARIDHSVSGRCVATLSYVFNHRTRELSKRLTSAHHDQHDLQIATMHVHLDHDNCLEVAILRGEAPAVREFSKSVIAERGVKHGQVSIVPVVIETESHAHGPHWHHGTLPHQHARPKD